MRMIGGVPTPFIVSCMPCLKFGNLSWSVNNKILRAGGDDDMTTWHEYI